MRVKLLFLLCALALSGCQIASSNHVASTTNGGLGEPPVRFTLPQEAALSEPAPTVATHSDPADAPTFDAPVFENAKGENRMLPTMKVLPIVDLDPIRDALLRFTQATAATAPLSPAPAPMVGFY